VRAVVGSTIEWFARRDGAHAGMSFRLAAEDLGYRLFCRASRSTTRRNAASPSPVSRSILSTTLRLLCSTLGVPNSAGRPSRDAISFSRLTQDRLDFLRIRKTVDSISSVIIALLQANDATGRSPATSRIVSSSFHFFLPAPGNAGAILAERSAASASHHGSWTAAFRGSRSEHHRRPGMAAHDYRCDFNLAVIFDWC